MFTTRLLSRLLSTRRRRQAIIELGQLSDHQLKDIGLTRHSTLSSNPSAR